MIFACFGYYNVRGNGTEGRKSQKRKILLYTNCATVVVPQMNAQTCGVYTSSTLDLRPYGSYLV